jgi:hypothetical protein
MIANVPSAVAAGWGRSLIIPSADGRVDGRRDDLEARRARVRGCSLACAVRVGLPSDNLGSADSNGDSNGNDQRQAAATYNSAGRSHIARQLGECSA